MELKELSLTFSICWNANKKLAGNKTKILKKLHSLDSDLKKILFIPLEIIETIFNYFIFCLLPSLCILFSFILLTNNNHTTYWRTTLPKRTCNQRHTPILIPLSSNSHSNSTHGSSPTMPCNSSTPSAETFESSHSH